MSIIIELANFKRTIKKESGCQHKKLEMDDHGGTVKCLECGMQLDLYWTIKSLVNSWINYRENAEIALKKAKEIENSVIHLRAAKLVEKAWRSKDMLPTCPHCHEAIAPEDGLGNSRINKRFARKNKKG